MVRKAILDDVNRIAEIHVMGWRFSYQKLISEEFLYKSLNVSKRITAFTKAIKERKEDIYVYEENDIIKGFMTIGPCRDTDKPYAFELWGLYVDPFMLRHGVGAKLLSYCEQKAFDIGYKVLVIWVLEDNSIGRDFYEKNGYKFDGARKLLDKFGIYEIRYQKRLK